MEDEIWVNEQFHQNHVSLHYSPSEKEKVNALLPFIHYDVQLTALDKQDI